MAICIQDTVEGMGIAIFWQLWKERKFSRFLTLYTMSFLFGGSKRFLVFLFSIIRPKESFFSVMNKNKNSRACLFEPVVHIQRYRSTYKHSHDSLIFSSYKCYKVNIYHDWWGNLWSSDIFFCRSTSKGLSNSQQAWQVALSCTTIYSAFQQD